MRVLWICNIMLPRVAEHLGLMPSNKEGWLTGLSERIVNHEDDNRISLAVAFPAPEGLTSFGQYIKFDENKGFWAYGFPEDTTHAENFQEDTLERLKEIVKDYKPDLVHCFGTEYPHTLAAVQAFGRPDRTLIGIQGLCGVYADYYRADLPDYVWNRRTFRDRIRKDDLQAGQEKYRQRGVFEKKAVQSVFHVTGRTHWDLRYMAQWNSAATYHFCDETLRSNFYKGPLWQAQATRPHSIFLSQGDYPIKGLHYVLRALPAVLTLYPDTLVFVTGNSIVKGAHMGGLAGLKGKLKLDSYGEYIMELLEEAGATDRIAFLGKKDAEQMRKSYLRSDVFVCPSSIENSPNSLGEAMLLGMPCISADVGGVSSIFTDGEDGILYPSGDVAALAKAIIKMFQGADELRRGEESALSKMCQGAREHALKTHDGEKNYETLLGIYDEIIHTMEG